MYEEKTVCLDHYLNLTPIAFPECFITPVSTKLRETFYPGYLTGLKHLLNQHIGNEFRIKFQYPKY